MTGDGSQLNSEGLLIVAGDGGSTLNIQAGGTVSNTFGYLSFGSSTSFGTATITGAGSQWNNTRGLNVGFIGTGVVHQTDGTVTVGDRGLRVGNQATGAGTYNLSGGTLDLTGGNILKGDGTATFNFTGGTLKNAATIDLGQAFVQSGGTLEPGNSPGTTTIVGGYTLGSGGTLAIELGGTTQGTEFDFVDVVGDLDLAGTLDVSLIDSFAPSFGDRFDILDWDSLTGTFDTVALPTLTDGLTWNLDDLYLTGELAVLLLGDTDGDGVVDLGDLVIITNNFGATGAGLMDGDLDGNGTVDLGDLVIVTNHFGNTGTASIASIPEPGSLALLGLGGLLLIRRRRA